MPRRIAGPTGLRTHIVLRQYPACSQNQREALIDFSQTYFVDQLGLLVQSTADIHTVEELNGQTIAVVTGASALDAIGNYVQANNIKVTVLPFQEYPPALAALKAGQVQALAAGMATLTRAAQADAKLTVLPQLLGQETYAIGLPHGDSYFRSLIDFTLQELKGNGLYDQIYLKWFPGTTPYAIERLPDQWPYTLATSPTTLTPPKTSRLDEIKKRGKLIVGVKYDFLIPA